MKLDRNTNKDGRGKYALIKLRGMDDEEYRDLKSRESLKPRVDFGDAAPGDQFFVLRYRDKFALEALKAYAKAVHEEVKDIQDELGRKLSSCFNNKELLDLASAKIRHAQDLLEYAMEIEAEAQICDKLRQEKLTKIPD